MQGSENWPPGADQATQATKDFAHTRKDLLATCLTQAYATSALDPKPTVAKIRLKEREVIDPKSKNKVNQEQLKKHLAKPEQERLKEEVMKQK